MSRRSQQSPDDTTPRCPSPFRYEQPQAGNRSCGCHYQRSYSDHDTQNCGIAGIHRNRSDDGSFGVEFRPYLPQRPARLGSCGHVVLFTDLRIWLLQRDGVLFRVPSSAAVVAIVARNALDRVIPSGNPPAAIGLPGWGVGRFGCSRSTRSLWGQVETASGEAWATGNCDPTAWIGSGFSNLETEESLHLLFQFHEEQNEDRPYSNGHWKLRQLCVSHGIPSWKHKAKPKHRQSCEYSEGQFGFGVHCVVLPRFQARPGCKLDGGSLATSIIIAKSAECNSFRPKSGGEVWSRGEGRLSSAFQPEFLLSALG
jgi:hypothetical protein